MFTPSKRLLALAVLVGMPLAGLADEVQSLQKVEVTSSRKKLDEARNGLSPDTGSSVYRLDSQDIKNLPRGDSTPLNQVILQTPGVVQGSYGQLHVRGDHGNVQYRINGVIIPESIGGFGQALETRFADHLSILTGALPAQYGLHNAAVVDIQSKGEMAADDASISFTGGSRGHAETSVEASGTEGSFSYYLTGSTMRDGSGIENPTPSSNALHDQTRQTKSFGYLSYLLDADSRISLLFGSSDNRFQIPNLPGERPQFNLASTPPLDSAKLDANQRERNRFAALSYQGVIGASLDYQLSVFQRVTDVHYQPDPIGDLQFNGVAADILRRNQASGLQADFSYRLGAHHTLRSGLFAQAETASAANSSTVFAADADGMQTSNRPIQIQDGSSIKGRLWGAYLQDEWRISPPLTLNYGLRYDQVRTVVDENQLSPRVGIVYDINKDLRLHAGYASYFTPPSTEKIDSTSVQKFLGTTNALPSDANMAIRSERSDYLDAGLAYQLTPQITLGLDGYHRAIKHLQDEGQFGKALIYSAFNFKQGRIYGLDLSASYRDKQISSYLNLGLSHAMAQGVESGQFNFAQDELDYINSHWVHLDHEQRLSASAGLSYRFENQLNLSADALFGSGMRKGFANTERLPGYATVNLAVAKPVDFGAGLGKLDLRLALNNLFDRIYQLRDGSGIGVGAPQFGMRRTIYLSVSKAFKG